MALSAKLGTIYKKYRKYLTLENVSAKISHSSLDEIMEKNFGRN